MNKSLFFFEGEYKKLVPGASGKEESSTEDIIPVMSSNSSPSGIAEAKSSLSANYPAFHAFNKEKKYFVSSAGLPQWISYTFEIPKIINRYALKVPHNSGDLNYAPINWTFEGSNDNGVNWTVLDIQTGEAHWVVNERRSFSFKNSSSFASYRLLVTSTVGNTYFGLDEIEMMEKIPATPFVLSTWESVSVSRPTVECFQKDGLEDLSLLNRKPSLFLQDMGIGNALVKGNVFTTPLNYKKFIQLNSISIKSNNI